MSILNELEQYLSENYDYVSPDEIDDFDALDALVKTSGINILSDKDINTVVLDGDKIIGASYVGINPDEMSFDVIVHPDYQQQGIAKELIDSVISEYEFNKEGYGDDFELIADVVNKNLIKLLKRLGFGIIEEYDGHTIMKYN